MGKKGDLLRARKAEAVIFHFTRRQMEEHDAAVRQEFRELLDQRMKEEVQKSKKEVDQYLLAEWDKRAEEFGAAGSQDRFAATMSHMLSIGAKVLIEEFKWTHINPNRNPGPRHRLIRWATRVADIVEDICSDETKDIREEANKIYEQYGVRFKWGTEE